MSDDLLIASLVLVLVDEVRRTGKCDLVDIFLDLFLCHTDTVISEGYGLVVGTCGHIDAVRLIWLVKFAHE